MTKTGAKPATVYLICGYIGAGKTTFAKRLEQRTGAVRITKDEWLIRLFGHDPLIDNFEHYDDTICALSNEIAFEFARRGIDVIIDDGFWVRQQRDEMKAQIRAIGATHVLYYVATPMHVIKERVAGRNKNLVADTFEVTPEVFEKYLKYWQPPLDDEGYLLAEL